MCKLAVGISIAINAFTYYLMNVVSSLRPTSLEYLDIKAIKSSVRSFPLLTNRRRGLIVVPLSASLFLHWSIARSRLLCKQLLVRQNTVGSDVVRATRSWRTLIHASILHGETCKRILHDPCRRTIQQEKRPARVTPGVTGPMPVKAPPKAGLVSTYCTLATYGRIF